MKTIAVLLTVFNRKDKTLECLQRLYNNVIPEGYTFDTYLVDDACTDGTPEEVAKRFPDVTIIEGNGQLFWNRGMYTAWEYAAKVKDYDFYVWLNDDTLLFDNALQIVLDAAQKTDFKSIISGPTCADANREEVTYSGTTIADSSLIKPNGSLQKCDIVNGNLLLVPREVYKVLGNLDWNFRHAIGDFDYGLRAKKNGFQNYIAPNFIGTCELNPTLPKWCLKETPLRKRFKLLYSPLGYAEPIPFFIYKKRHFGMVNAVKHFISINLRALLPGLWK